MKKKDQHLDEDEAIFFLRQIINGLKGLHLKYNIMHRNLKLDNIFLHQDKSTQQLLLKIGDVLQTTV